MRFVRYIETDSIIIGENRQRREFDEAAHQELITSIQTRGLMHAIVVRESGGAITLVAGERRLRAIKELYELGGTFLYDGSAVPPLKVPYVTLGDLSPLDAEEAELEENVRRVDLSWQERVEADARLVDLRKRQAEAAGLPAPKIADLAQEIRGRAEPTDKVAVSRSLVLAANLHRPEVKNAKSAKEALKAMAKAEERERNAELAAKLGKEFLGSKHTLVHGNCLDWLRTCEAGTFDVICSDPPYGMGADEFGDSGTGAGGAGAHFYDDSEDTWLDLMKELLPALTFVAKPNAHLYLFCDPDKFPILRHKLTEMNWRVFRTPLIWHKPAGFRAPWPEHGPQRKYETILFAVRGDLKCTKILGDVLSHGLDDSLGHPAQKPVALIEDLLSRSIRPGMTVLDPFCGSGPIFPAGHRLSAVVTGIEMDAASYATASKRLSDLKEQ